MLKNIKLVFGKILQSCTMFFFKFFPIQEKRILFMSYYGKQVNCNPYALYEYIKENNCPFECIYVDNCKSDMGKNTKTIKYRSFMFYYYLRTSKFLIFNARPNIDIQKRRKQFYIQTWHSSLGFKMIEKDAEATLDKKYVRKAKKDSTYIDLLISGCKFRTECFRRNFWYDGNIAEVGTPRNDILFSCNKELISQKVKNELGIENNVKIILYAPTFRNSDDLSYATSLDVNQLLNTLKNRFGGNWILIYRLHPNVSKKVNLSKDIIDASTYKDMQSLLIVSDILVTDYSSVMFDFMLLNRPCFLYAPDYESYKKTERNTYFSISELPFDISLTTDSLSDAIQKFDKNHYLTKIGEFKKEIGSFEDGTACIKIIDIMKKVV